MEANKEAGFRDSVVFPVNNIEVRFHDAVVTGRQVLTNVGMTPPSEHQLILVRKGRTKLIGTDDEVDLLKEAGGVFRAFPGDRSYSFTMDEVGEVWGATTMEVDELLSIVSVPAGRDLVLEREDEPDTILRPGGTLSFKPEGTEHIVSRLHHGPEFVMVMVITTGGIFPAEGAARVKATTPVAEVLARAGRKLGLGDTTNWVTSVDGRDINPALSFEANGLAGAVEIEWGPREGGGGHA